MIADAIRGLWERWWLTLAGGIVGIFLAPTVSYAVAALTDFYYSLAPVSEMRGTVLKADTEEIIVHLYATKRYAPACQYLMLRARTIDEAGEYEQARVQRIDRPATGEPLPEGSYDIGVWRIVPRSDGVKVTIAAVYDCAGRVVWGSSVKLALP